MPNPSQQVTTDSQPQPSWKTLDGSTSVAGYAAPAFSQGECNGKDNAAIAKAVSKVLGNPMLLRQLSERVYELMLRDLHKQRERSRNYGSLF